MAHLLIAVRGGHDAKRRCAGVLTPAVREALTAAMLEDMLAAIADARSVDAVTVITPTDVLASLASARGARVLLEPSARGLNAAFAAGRDGATGSLHVLLPGDLPCLDPVELSELIESWRPGEALLVAAQGDGGTGAILLDAAAPFAFAYGRNSLARHADEAWRRDLRLRLATPASLSFDLDRPQDIATVIARRPHGRTAALLSHPIIVHEAR